MKKPVVLITHEESQEVTKAFRALGIESYSNDIKDCSGGFMDYHIKGDCFDAIDSFGRLDFLGCHPVCRYLANSGVRWLASKKQKQGFEWSDKYQIFINWERFSLMELAANHFRECLQKVKKVGTGYVENPIMHKYAMEIIGEKPTQVIQPWMFGHAETKATCLWIVGLPKLTETNNVYKEMMQLPYAERAKVHHASPGPERESLRSKTLTGIAMAFASQWSEFLTHQ